MACETCMGDGYVSVQSGPLRRVNRGCPDCQLGQDFEARLARQDAAQRERDMDATGQDQEAFDGEF